MNKVTFEVAGWSGHWFFVIVENMNGVMIRTKHRSWSTTKEACEKNARVYVKARVNTLKAIEAAMN